MNPTEELAKPIRSEEALKAIIEALYAEYPGFQTDFRFDPRPISSGSRKWIPQSTMRLFLQRRFSSSMLGTYQSVLASHGCRWWQYREVLRHLYNVYQPLSADLLEVLDGQSVYMMWGQMAHVSTEDKTRIAYTASIGDGEADRQRVSTLAGWMARYAHHSWHMADDHFADINARYLGAITDELEILPHDQIAAAYDNGPSSCMVGKEWPLTFDGHVPPEAYDMPGYGLAVIRDTKDSTKFSQRCLVWVNPQDPEDKRYIRVYGSGPLERRLQRNGYKLSGHAGARLKLVPLPEVGENAYLMPYLDHQGGRNNGGYVLRREDCLQVVTAPQGFRLIEAGISLGATNNASGWATSATITEAQLTRTDAVTGAQYSILDSVSGGLQVVRPNAEGQLETLTTFADSIDLVELGYVSAYAKSAPGKKVFAKDVKLGYSVDFWSFPLSEDFRQRATPWVVDESFLENRTLLAESVYGKDLYAETSGLVKSEAGYIFDVDALFLHDKDASGTWIRRIVVAKGFDLTNWKKVRGGSQWYARKRVKLETAQGIRRLSFIPGFHEDVIQTFCGQWVAKAEATSVSGNTERIYLGPNEYAAGVPAVPFVDPKRVNDLGTPEQPDADVTTYEQHLHWLREQFGEVRSWLSCYRDITQRRGYYNSLYRITSHFSYHTYFADIRSAIVGLFTDSNIKAGVEPLKPAARYLRQALKLAEQNLQRLNNHSYAGQITQLSELGNWLDSWLAEQGEEMLTLEAAKALYLPKLEDFMAKRAAGEAAEKAAAKAAKVCTAIPEASKEAEEVASEETVQSVAFVEAA